jgi:Lon-like protease
VQASSELPFIRRTVATTPTARLRRTFDWLLWEDKHRRLAAHPLLAGCTRQQVRRIARVADEAKVPAGQALVREDRIGYWMFLLEKGTVRLTRHRQTVGTLGPGDHLGDAAIVGFGPHPATATATTDVEAFVIGRVEVLSLVRDVPPLQRNLYPGVAPERFAEHVRSMRAEGAKAWSKLPKMAVPVHADLGALGVPTPVASFSPAKPPAVGVGSFPALAVAVLRRQREPRPAPAPRPELTRRTVAVLGGLVVAALAAFGLLYHPPVVVVTPGEPFDVASDITVEGRPVSAISGRYLLVPVHLDRPNVFGALTAIVQGRRRIPARHVPAGADTGAARRRGREAFDRSRNEAAVAAARAAGLAVPVRGAGARVVGNGGGLLEGDVVKKVGDRPVEVASDVVEAVARHPVGGKVRLDVGRAGAGIVVETETVPGADGVAALSVALRTVEPHFELPFQVRFRDRDLVGGSGGLIYSLALADLLDERDLARGRTIAATGGVDPSGVVVPIEFVEEKTRAARRSGAATFFVPTGQGGAGVGAVGSVAGAVRLLAG